MNTDRLILQLRCVAEAWIHPMIIDNQSMYGEIYDKATKNCGTRLTEILDECGADKLEDEIE